MKKPKTDLSRNLVKPGESLIFEGNEVTKHFDDERIVRGRIERAKILGNLVPRIIRSSRHSYTYRFVEGDLLSDVSDRKKFEEFLSFSSKTVWKKVKLSPKEKAEFRARAKKFYFDKTMRRLEKFYKDTGTKDLPTTINGRKRPKLSTLLKKVDWKGLADGIPVVFHGDFQPENILVTKNGFKLLDWRHEFEGLTGYGDIYYDFAKLYHALVISNEIIRNGQYAVKKDKKGSIGLKYLIKSNLLGFKDIFEDFIAKKGYDLRKVRVLSALVYLNIAPLYDYPYNEFLYYLGVDFLANEH